MCAKFQLDRRTHSWFIANASVLNEEENGKKKQQQQQIKRNFADLHLGVIYFKFGMYRRAYLAGSFVAKFG